MANTDFADPCEPLDMLETVIAAEAATKVWDRLLAKGVASYDPDADVYEYTGQEAAG